MGTGKFTVKFKDVCIKTQKCNSTDRKSMFFKRHYLLSPVLLAAHCLLATRRTVEKMSSLQTHVIEVILSTRCIDECFQVKSVLNVT